MQFQISRSAPHTECYIYIYIYGRFGGACPACPTPRNREIGFVSSSFSFRACRACRACGRGEAARAHVERHSSRWASRVLVSTCSGPLGGDLLCAGAWVLSVFAQKSGAFVHLLVRRHVGFKRFHILDMQLFCAGTWVFYVFWAHWGFLGIFFAQAHGF